MGLIPGWGVGGGGGLLSEFYGMPRASGVYAASLLFAKCAARDVLDNFEILLIAVFPPNISTTHTITYTYDCSLLLLLFFFSLDKGENQALLQKVVPRRWSKKLRT